MSTVLFRGGPIITGHPGAPCTALAVADDRIVAVGDEAEGWCTRWDEVVDLDGRAAIPGFRDGHVHPLSGGIESITLNLAGIDSIDGVLAAVRAWAAARPADTWIEGGSYESSLLPNGIGDAFVLDTACADRPVVLYSNDHHMVWVNSHALRVAGIDAGTPEPPLGTIVRRGDGSPMGTLLEWGAIALIERHLPEPDPALQRAGLVAGMATLAESGIVWAQDAVIDPSTLGVYVAGAHDSVLTCRVNGAFKADPQRWRTQFDDFVAARLALEADPVASAWVSARTVKFFADGVIEAGTGFMLEPYDDAPHSCGLPNWSPEGLAEAVRAFDAAGFQIHIHAIGDGGVRMSLDAIEHATTINGQRDRRATIAHTQVVQPVDRPRFAALGVIANFEPLWARLDPVQIRLTAPRLGPARTALQYPIASLAASGAIVSFGSDWPVTSVRPLDGLAVAVTRQTRDGVPAEGWLPEERATTLAALGAYTRGTAFQAFDDDAGSLSVGQRADICVLAHDITAMAGLEISDVPLDQTWVGGIPVHRRA